MSFVRIKVIKGRKYKYLVENKWMQGGAVQKVLKYLGPVNPVRRLPKKRKRAPEINLEDIQELSPWEKIFLATAIVVQEKAKTAYLDDVLELAKEYCKKAKIAHPAAWDQSVDYFKTLGWLELKDGKIKFLLPKSKLKEIKKALLREQTEQTKNI